MLIILLKLGVFIYLSDPEAGVMLCASQPTASTQRLSFIFIQQEALLRRETTLQTEPDISLTRENTAS